MSRAPDLAAAMARSLSRMASEEAAGGAFPLARRQSGNSDLPLCSYW